MNEYQLQEAGYYLMALIANTIGSIIYALVIGMTFAGYIELQGMCTVFYAVRYYFNTRQ